MVGCIKHTLLKMKYFFTLLVAWVTLPMFAQTNFHQTARVRAFNSGKKPVANIQILYSNAVPTASDAKGQCCLVFVDKKKDDWVFKADIAQKGYELVNAKAVECVKLNRDTQAFVDIIVAKTGTLAAAQKAYYAVLDSTLKGHFFDEKVKLKAGRYNTQAAKRTYQDEYEAIQKGYSQQKKGLYGLSQQLAEVNGDDVNTLHQDVLQFIKEGNIDAALLRLDNYGLLANIHAYVNTLTSKTDDKDSVKTQNDFKQNLTAINLLAHLHLLMLKPFNAETLYDQMLVFDSTNLDILRGSATFYRGIHQPEKALTLYAKLLVHPSIDGYEKAQTFLAGGDALADIGEWGEAVNAFTQGKNSYTQWLKENPNAPFLKYQLSNIYGRLGNAYLALGNVDKATVFYKNYQRLAQELTAIYPDNAAFKSNLATAYEKLGRLQTHSGDATQSLAFYGNSYLLRKALYLLDSTNLQTQNDLSIACEKLGTAHRDAKQLDKTVVYYEQFNALKTALFMEDVNDGDAKNNAALAEAKLGAVYQSSGNTDKALVCFTNYNRLAKELYTENLNNVDYKNSLAQSFTRLAETHATLTNWDKAVIYYEERLKLNQELCVQFPNNTTYKNNLSVVYSKLGTVLTTLGELDKALVYYEKDIELSKELYAAHPKNVYFKNGLALAYSKLGTFYKDKKNDKAQADVYFEQGKALLSELVAATPTSADYKNNLKWVEEKLAEK